MITLSESTLKKYEQGYRKASTVLKAYLPEKVDFNSLIKQEDETPETGFTNPENLQFYTFRECNLLITHKVAEKRNKPPKGCIQTGQANRPSGLPYARIYTDPKTGKIYVVKTGY